MKEFKEEIKREMLNHNINTRDEAIDMLDFASAILREYIRYLRRRDSYAEAEEAMKRVFDVAMYDISVIQDIIKK